MGFERGWALWSVYGKLCASSFSTDNQLERKPNDAYLDGLSDGAWLPGSVEIILIGGYRTSENALIRSENIWVMEMARSAVTSLFSAVSKILDLEGISYLYSQVFRY